jgi:hypothetical protein
MKIETRMASVKSRVIDALKLDYLTMKRGHEGDNKGAETSITPDGGFWNFRTSR